MYAATCCPGDGLVPFKVSTADGTWATVLLGYSKEREPTPANPNPKPRERGGVVGWEGSHRQAALAAAPNLLANPHEGTSWHAGVLVVESEGERTCWRLIPSTRVDPEHEEDDDEGETYTVPLCVSIEWSARLVAEEAPCRS